MAEPILITTDLPIREAPVSLQEAKAVEIVDQPSYDKAVELLATVRAVIGSIETDRKQMKRGVIDAGKAIDAKAAGAKKPWQDAERILASRVRRFLEEAERARRSEQLRIEAEHKRQLEAEALENAENLQKAGASPQMVDAAIDERTIQQTAPPAPTAPQIDRGGAGIRHNWKAEVDDFSALVDWCSETGSYHLLLANQSALNQMAKAQRNLLKIPGIRAWDDRGVGTRKR